MARKPEYAGPWRRIRQQILQRDNHQCQIQATGCTSTATQVDHIIPTSQGGPWWDPTNLRATCAHCNNQRIDRTRQNRWQHKPDTHITIINGPPAAGKTTHTLNHAKPHDLIIDYDLLATAIGAPPNRHHRQINQHPHHKATTTIRNALITAARRGELDHPRIWITTTHPDPTHLPHHTITTIDPGLEQTLKQSLDRGDPPHIQRLITDWYRQRDHRGEGTTHPTARSNSRSW